MVSTTSSNKKPIVTSSSSYVPSSSTTMNREQAVDQQQQQQQEQEQQYLYYEKNAPCFVWTLILAPCCMPLIWKYHVTLTDTEISFGFSSSLLQITIPRVNIIEVEVLSMIHPICEWGGYGIRKQLPSWDTGYIARKGPGVRIRIQKPTNPTTNNNNNTVVVETNYTFSCHDPDEVVRILST